MFTDWAASDFPGIFARTYTTTIFDRVTSSRIEVVSVPPFVAVDHLPSLDGLGTQRAAKDKAASQKVLLAEMQAVVKNFFGCEAETFSMARTPGSPTNDEKLAAIRATSEQLPAHRFLSTNLALDMMIGRESHRAFRPQLEAATIPVEASPPSMYSVTSILSSSVIGSMVGGVGGLFLTAAGGLLGIVVDRAGASAADEFGFAVRRQARGLSDVGRLENEKERLSLENEVFKLREENLRLRAARTKP